MKQKKRKLIYKLHSKQLKKAKWNLTLDLNEVIRDTPEYVVALSDSQLLRFIDDLNGITDAQDQIAHIQKMIRIEKKKPRSIATRKQICALYEKLYELQFQKDYVCIIMDSNADYDRANKGFTINGIKYRRFLGTNGGIKNSTIVYVNEELYPELKRRLDNGRNMDIPLVPAKLEAYQALVCSGSTPLPSPNGFIVVKDCVTRFTDNVYLITDEAEGEPVLTFEKNYSVEHNASDGFGLMLPSYSRKVNEFMTGDGEHTISGMNTRYAWTKGMVYTFDFVEFAEKVAGTYEITDVWGHKRDVRDAEVILTESMLKLWNCYSSWEDYYENCQKNGYQFSATKTTPMKLENVRDTNYQFLQSYTLSDEELQELCQPTIDEINDVLGLDYRKTLAFLTGDGLNESNIAKSEFDPYIQALMIDRRMLNDPYVRKRVWRMISKRIDDAKHGTIRVNANYAMISGDPYALAQNMFDLEVTGLLKAQEIYHKYWIEKGADELVCFRAPMTCHNNIRKMKLCKNEEAAHWYQYIRTVLIFNAWDTACEAMNGSDFDGDTNMCTDNPILLKRTLNSPTIMCVQRKAEKKVVTEDDIIQANKLAFNDDIGTITNRVTSMIEVQAGFEPGTKEYETLSYRIMCGQLLQQNCIDRAKGIIAKPMPTSWYSYHGLKIEDQDDEEAIAQKEFNKRIVAGKKPYFMRYIYPSLKKEYKDFTKSADKNAGCRFYGFGIRGVDDLYKYEPKTEEMVEFLRMYEHNVPTGNNPCLVNRMCRIFEKEFASFKDCGLKGCEFDYSFLMSGSAYSKKLYNDVARVFKQHTAEMRDTARSIQTEKVTKEERIQERIRRVEEFQRACLQICPNEDELADIVLDLCYPKENSKQFAWDVCGDVIVKRLWNINMGVIHYPELADDEDAEFSFKGKTYKMNMWVREIDDYCEREKAC